MFKFELKKILLALGISVAVFGLIWLISSKTSLLEGLERRLGDFYFFLREPSPPDAVGGSERNKFVSDRVQLVAIDSPSIAAVGRWPWYRDAHARYLDNLYQFSPQATHIDIAFDLMQWDMRSPNTRNLRRNFEAEPKTLAAVERGFLAMDQSLTGALSRHHNTYIDLFLGEPGPDGPGYEERAAVTERSMANFSQPADDTARPTTAFLLPIIEEYAKASQPLVANVWVDDDSILRNFSLVHPFRQTDGQMKNYFSIPLGMLMTYYRITKNDVVIENDRMTLRGAKVPRLDPKTKETLRKKVSVEDLKTALEAVGPKPANYNENLYRLFLLEFNLLYASDTEKEPYLPITLLKKGDKFTLLEGREIWDAALAVGSKKVNAVICDTKDVEIRFRKGFKFPYSIPINYGAHQEVPYRDPVDKSQKIWHPIPTLSAKEIYNLGQMPELPLMENSKVMGKYDESKVSFWFVFSHIPKQVAKIHEILAKKRQKPDVDGMLGFLANQNSDLGKYFLYDMYMENGGRETPVHAWEAGFAAFVQDPEIQEALKKAGFTDMKDLHLNERDVITALQMAWSDQFSRFYNKAVFTAAYTTGMATDVHQTPFGSMFGINAIIYGFSTVVTENQLTIVENWKQILALALVCLLFGLFYGTTNIRLGLVVFLISALGVLIGAYLMFDLGNTLMKVIPVTAANLLLFISLLVYKLLTEEKDKQFLKATFSSYLAPELIDQMYESKTMPKLGGEPGIRTAFFTDIQGFSTFSEKLTSEELVELLNEYLNSMTNILLHEKGTLDKYIGDAIIGIFGAPMPMEDHSIRALRVAVRMQQNLDKLREKWRGELAPPGVNRNSKNLPPEQWEPGKKWPVIVYDMRVRVGINSGDMTTGNMGSTMRMNYTMMGDTVNTAARLEAGAKQFGVYTLVSESTLNHVFTDETGKQVKTADLVHYRFIDRITVVGKTEPVEIFEVIGIKGESDLTPEQQELFAQYAEGVKAYQNCEWDRALEIFHKTKEIELFKQNKMTPSKMYIERCLEYKQNPPVPPGQKWDGVYHMTQKH